MRLGMHLRELSRLRAGVAISLLVALFVAAWSVAEISLFPPGWQSREVEMAAAHTEVVVDTPKSTILDLRQPTDDITALKNRSLLIGNVMASPPVRAYIARRAGISAETLQVVTPRTPAEPRAREASNAKKGPEDLLRSTDQYRLDIQANPTVPILDVDAQAPSAEAAGRLANAAADGLRDYLGSLANAESTPSALQVRVRQLGRARGEVLNEGVALEVALLTFLLVFAASCAAVVVVSRVSQGWRVAQATAP
jgi:hypothetical protein